MSGPAPGELEELVAWLRIPSISGDQRFAADVRRAARWLADWLRAAGAQVRVIPGSAAPVVTGVFRGRRAPGDPLAVVYGHYDVQPPGPGWTVPPFGARVHAGRLVARGASDDKGQLFAHLLALRRLVRRGDLRGETLVVAEGAEEIGSPGFVAALAELPPRPARVVVVSDTQRAGRDTPAITVSQRGMVRLHVRVDVGGRPVHPGRYAGAVVDPSLVLAGALARLACAVDALPAVAPAVRAPAVVDSPAVVGPRPQVMSDAELFASSGGRAAAPVPAGQTRHAWLTTHAAVAVSRLRAGGTSAATPTVASAIVDVRLPPGVRPEPAAALLRAVLTARVAAPTRLDITSCGRAVGYHRMPPTWVLRAVDNACLAGFGRRPAYVRSGGSVPAVAMLASAFGVARCAGASGHLMTARTGRTSTWI